MELAKIHKFQHKIVVHPSSTNVEQAEETSICATKTSKKQHTRPSSDPTWNICFPSWNPYTSRNINKIEAVHRHAARFVLGNYKYSPTSGLTHDIHNRLRWIPLHHRRALYDLALFYKICSNNDQYKLSTNSTTILATTRQIRTRPGTPLRCLQRTSTICLIVQFEHGTLYQIKPYHQQLLLNSRQLHATG